MSLLLFFAFALVSALSKIFASAELLPQVRQFLPSVHTPPDKF